MVRHYNRAPAPDPDPEPFTPSLDDSLSPSDGYFQDRSPAVPQQVFVQEPTQEVDSKGKERERKQDAQANHSPTRSYTPYTPTSSTSAGTPTRRYRDENTALETSPPLLDTAPPPAYEAATAGRDVPAQSNTASNGNDADTPQETTRLLSGFNALEIGPDDIFRRGSGRAPESMRGGRPLYQDRIGRASRVRRCCQCCNFSFSRAAIKKVLLILLVLSVIGGIVCGVASGNLSGNPCSGAHYSKTAVFEFNPKSFTFERANSDVSKMRTGGHVEVVRGNPSTQKSAIKVELYLKSSDKNVLKSDSLITQTPQSLTINSPSRFTAIPNDSHWVNRLNSCFSIEATISVLPGTVLADFHLLIPSLSLKLANDLSVTVTRSTKIKSTSSGITFPPTFSSPGDKQVFSSRETHIHLTSGSIHGSYPLLDLLDVSTMSGSIAIDVIPEDADPSSPDTPATLRASAKSGSISINYPRAYGRPIPQRNYITSALTKSGSIAGHYIHGSETSLSTTSGSISVSILPFHAQNVTSSSLHTSTSSGSSSIHLQNPPLNQDQNLKGLTARHECLGSGSADVYYPRIWEGTATVHVGGSGSVGVGGNGIEVVRRDRKSVVGVKGDKDASDVELYGRGSGSMRFTVEY